MSELRRRRIEQARARQHRTAALRRRRNRRVITNYFSLCVYTADCSGETAAVRSVTATNDAAATVAFESGCDARQRRKDWLRLENRKFGVKQARALVRPVSASVVLLLPLRHRIDSRTHYNAQIAWHLWKRQNSSVDADILGNYFQIMILHVEM